MVYLCVNIYYNLISIILVFKCEFYFGFFFLGYFGKFFLRRLVFIYVDFDFEKNVNILVLDLVVKGRFDLINYKILL